MNQCTRCGGEVPDFAQACMHCGAVFTNTTQYQERLKSDQQSYGCGTLAGVVIVIGALLYTWFTGGFE
jgi:hypothetical protein